VETRCNPAYGRLNQASTWMANRRMRPRDTPWKLLFLMNSYRLMERMGKEMHRWCRK
jgi:hypothetical protein